MYVSIFVYVYYLIPDYLFYTLCLVSCLVAVCEMSLHLIILYSLKELLPPPDYTAAAAAKIETWVRPDERKIV